MNKSLTLKEKKSYYAKVRGSNYRASLRLEDFSVSEAEPAQGVTSREAVLAKYRAKVEA